MIRYIPPLPTPPPRPVVRDGSRNLYVVAAASMAADHARRDRRRRRTRHP